MMFRSAAAAFVVIGASLLEACGGGGGGDDGESATPPPPTFAGTYLASSEGAFAFIVFDGDAQRYQLAPDGCVEARCIEKGRFAFSGDTLTLTDDRTGNARTLPVTILARRSAEESDSLTTTKTLVGGEQKDLVGDGQSIVQASQPLSSSVGRALVAQQDIKLIIPNPAWCSTHIPTGYGTGAAQRRYEDQLWMSMCPGMLGRG